MGIWAVVGIVLACLACGGIYLARLVRTYSRLFFGTDSLAAGLSEAERRAAETPKSVSAMTTVYLPQIARDFPEFQWEEARARAENVLIGWMRAINDRDPGRLPEAGDDLREAVRAQIAAQTQAGQRERFEQPRVHRTEISRYQMEHGRRVIVLQSAAQAVHYLAQGGAVVKGREDLPEQALYELELAHVQDRALAGADGTAGLTCPHCGAPVDGLGDQECTYCGGAVAAFNVRAWQFIAVRRVEKQSL